MKSIKAFSFLMMIAVILFGCQKEYSVENGGTSGMATGTLKSGGSGECLPSSVQGVYTAGIATNAANYINVDVDITALGSYTINTNIVNGYSFSATGVATTLGVQTIKLNASGTPVANGANTFTVKFGTSQCNLVVDVLGAGSSNLWSFKVGTSLYSGTTSVSTVTTVPTTVSISGTNASAANFSLVLGTTSGVLETGTYPGTVVAPGKVSMSLNFTEGATAYSFLSMGGGDISTTVTTYDNVAKVIEGTFSGTAKTGTLPTAGTTVTITEGKFKATLP